MAAETIYKLQPHRTMHLRGFDRRGAAAAMHSASATGFTVSGVFRDPADFAVLMLYDADDYFGHPRWRYLPDFDFSGITLQFDVEYTGLQPLDSPKYPSIDWPFLDVIKADGSTAQVSLFDNAVQQAGTYSQASADFVLTGTPVGYDRVSLWYQNIAFDFWVSNPPESAAQIVTALAAQINGYDYEGAGVAIPLEADANGTTLTVRAGRAGVDGNMIEIYGLHKYSGLYWTPAQQKLAGGSSAATWRVTLDFDALSLTSIRKAWLTFAPELANGAAYQDTEWEAAFTNWSVTGDHALAVADAAKSVRVGSRSKWAVYTGDWSEEAGFYWLGFARATSTPGDTVVVKYHSRHTHYLYVGTSLYTDRGIWEVRLDGDTATDLDCYLNDEPALNTRRLVRSGVAAGEHSLELKLKSTKNAASSGYNVYVDYLEAAVAGDVPDAPETYTDVSVATDWDTDHTYKLPPQRLVWQIGRSGLVGDINHYVGVFWWNQRVRMGGTFPVWTVTFGGTWADGDAAFVTIGGTTMGKSVFPADTVDTIAAHFAAFINETFVGVWASATGGVLTVTCRSPQYSFTASTSQSSSAGTISESGSLADGVEGTWTIDAAATPVLNVAARDWHADYFAEIEAAGWTATAAFSMELVDPPDDPGGGQVWAARYLDDEPVLTATGFGALSSTHCAFTDVVAAYMQQAFAEMADLMNGAGLTPWLQFGETLWWFFANEAGMAYYDVYTAAEALAALGRDLEEFYTPADDPSVNGYADAAFLAGQLKAYIDGIRTTVLAAQAGAKFELLWPLDVNEPDLERLNRYVNLPVEYEQKSGSGLDRLKMEALAFGAYERDLGKARRAARYPFEELAWSKDDVRYLMPWFNGGCPWAAEFLAAARESLPNVAFWAWDHLGLIGWPLPLPTERRLIQLVGE